MHDSQQAFEDFFAHRENYTQYITPDGKLNVIQFAKDHGFGNESSVRERWQLPHLDFGGFYNTTNIYLEGADLSQCSLDGCDLAKGRFSGVDFPVLNNVSFVGAELEDINIPRGSRLDFTSAQMEGMCVFEDVSESLFVRTVKKGRGRLRFSGHHCEFRELRFLDVVSSDVEIQGHDLLLADFKLNYGYFYRITHSRFVNVDITDVYSNTFTDISLINSGMRINWDDSKYNSFQNVELINSGIASRKSGKSSEISKTVGTLSLNNSRLVGFNFGEVCFPHGIKVTPGTEMSYVNFINAAGCYNETRYCSRYNKDCVSGNAFRAMMERDGARFDNTYFENPPPPTTPPAPNYTGLALGIALPAVGLLFAVLIVALIIRQIRRRRENIQIQQEVLTSHLMYEFPNGFIAWTEKAVTRALVKQTVEDMNTFIRLARGQVKSLWVQGKIKMGAKQFLSWGRHAHAFYVPKDVIRHFLKFRRGHFGIVLNAEKNEIVHQSIQKRRFQACFFDSPERKELCAIATDKALEHYRPGYFEEISFKEVWNSMVGGNAKWKNFIELEDEPPEDISPNIPMDEVEVEEPLLRRFDHA